MAAARHRVTRVKTSALGTTAFQEIEKCVKTSAPSKAAFQEIEKCVKSVLKPVHPAQQLFKK